ncbi:hypothetical protein ACEWY4_003599 [Coilia grayii]|uniref:Ig-like domain-containing protein n=1 Tax=Coilia grayii TaxID=363190 RepID=A0ABD1KST9_9TELE
MEFSTVMVSIIFFLPTFCAEDIDAERHSLYYVYTALSKAVSAPGIFEFIAMGLLDDRKIDYYNSADKVKVPQQDWMTKKLPQDYWEKGTQSRKSKEQWFKVNVNILMERMRQNTSDLHTLMWRHVCEANRMPDGSLQFVKGVDEYSYDGMDFLSFDDDSMQWVAPVSAAVQTKRKWDGVPILNQYTKGYLEKECVEWLHTFMKHGNVELHKQLTDHPPRLHLFAKSGTAHDMYKLTCLATGFYPKDIELSLLKSGWPVLNNHIKDVLPNGDGTHQTRLSVETKRSEMNDYGCEFTHWSLKKPIAVTWPEAGMVTSEQSSLVAVVLGLLLAVLAIAVVMCSLFIAVKKGTIGIRKLIGGIEEDSQTQVETHEMESKEGAYTVTRETNGLSKGVAVR